MFPSTAQLLYLLRLGGSRTWALALILLLTRPIRAAITQHLFSKELLVEKSFGKQQQLRIVGLRKQIFCREGRKVLSKLSKKDIRANVLRLFSGALSRLSFPMSEINTAKWFSDRVATFHLWPMLESTWVGDWYLVPMCQSTIGLRWPLLVTTETRSTTQPSNTYSRGFIPTNRHQNDKTFSQLLGFSLFDYKNECSFLPADRVTTSPKLCRAHPMFHLCTTLMIWIWNFYKLSKWVSISIDGWNLATYYIHAPFGITENLSLNLIG